jgi:site-specific DNA-methyltransferase (adenine-specific)
LTKIDLYMGDCLDLMRDLADGSVDMILCDLPYGTTACAWDTVIPFEPLWEQYKRIIKKNGAIVLFGSQPFTTDLIMSNRKWFRYEWIWEKGVSGSFVQASRMPLKTHENICVFSGGDTLPNYYPIKMKRVKAITFNGATGSHAAGGKIKHNEEKLAHGKVYEDSFPQSIVYITPRGGGERGLHPTQKPVPLCEYLIRTYTNEGETVLDNTMGSGSTGVAAVRTNRNFIGMEMEKSYFDLAKQRIESAQQPLFT